MDGMNFETGDYQVETAEAQLVMSVARLLAEGAGLHALASSLMILALCHEKHPESHSLDLNLTIMRKWVMLEKAQGDASPATPTEIEELMDRVRRGGEVLAELQRRERAGDDGPVDLEDFDG